ncbi:iron-dicitrate transporter ATP-binding subunit [Brachybacterium sp. P6-10-X1]|uniref:ABC transporter ATP-binding protein n=1 Tax=Brachybacterium sp. P6-10-X1 TaxID=1903186 RepID=UPI000971B5EC|nr:ABC transporter ATP-binding protein [Brachybacterium sp. P6-10-X1]APX33499.1 iron-dicitrate transporter ATP-binding subunit [Brachybacterium sp. P6-10-X1]
MSAPETASSLRLAGATVAYGERPVLEGLDFTVPRGAFTAVIGPNGCGKSTMLKTLARTLRPRAGAALLDERPLSRWRPKAVARRIALLPQDPVVPDGITVRSLVGRGRHPYHSPLRQRQPGDDDAVSAALSATGVQQIAERPVAALSGGQRQRVWVAMILAQDTEYVLLDEPTSSLDVAHQIDVLHLCQDMREQGRTVVTVLHDLNQAARYADHLVVMDAGRIVASGAPEEVLREQLVADVFGLRAQIAADPLSGSPMVVPMPRDS